MPSKVIIKSDESSVHSTVVHFSNDSRTRILHPGESIEVSMFPAMCINMFESEEDYSHGESDSGKDTGNDPAVGSPLSETPLEFQPKETE